MMKVTEEVVEVTEEVVKVTEEYGVAVMVNLTIRDRVFSLLLIHLVVSLLLQPLPQTTR